MELPNGGAVQAVAEERPEVARRRRRRRIVWRIVWAIIVLSVLGSCGGFYVRIKHAAQLATQLQFEERAVEQSDVEVVVAETGIVEPLSQVIVKSQVAAQVRAILVNEGDVVRKGQVVALLDDSRIRQDVENRAAQVDSALAEMRKAGVTLTQADKTSSAGLASAKATIEQAAATLTLTRNGNRPEDIEKAQEAVSQARAQLVAGAAHLDELKAGARPQEVAEQEQTCRQTDAQLAQAEAALIKLESGNRKEEIAEAQAQADQAVASQRASEARLAKARAGSRPQEVAQANADLSAAQAKLTETEATFTRQDQLRSAGYSSEQAVETAKSARDSARATVASRREALDLLVEGTRAEDVRAAEADVEQARAAARAAAERLTVQQSGARVEEIEQQRQAVAAARAASKAQASRLDMLKAGNREEQIRQQEATVQQLEAALRSAEANRQLVTVGSRKEDIEKAEAAVREAEAGLERAIGQGLDPSVRAEDIVSARAQLQAAGTQLERAREDLSDCTLESPIDGTVLKRHIEPGELAASGTTGLAQGTPVVTVGNTSQMLVKLQVHEVDIVSVQPNLPVEVRLDAFQGEQFSGTVSEIAPQSTAVSQEQAAGRTGGTQAGVATFEVRVMLDKPDERIRAGMNARVKIVCDRATGVPAVTLAALHSEENQTYVLVPAATPGGQPEKREVTLGLRGQSFVEVKSGLSVGDKYLVRKPKTGINIREGGR